MRAELEGEEVGLLFFFFVVEVEVLNEKRCLRSMLSTLSLFLLALSASRWRTCDIARATRALSDQKHGREESASEEKREAKREKSRCFFLLSMPMRSSF